MTYKEWFLATCSKFNLEEKDVDLILINQNLSSEDDVDVKVAKKALCKEIPTLIPLNNISEGGFSLSWNVDLIKFWYSQTCRELGLVDLSKPQIRNKSNLW